MTGDAVHETRRVTLVAPRGTLVVRAPRDVAINDLMPDFIAAGMVGDEAHACTNGWVLCTGDGDPYPPTATLTDCGIESDDVLVLRRRNDAPASHQARSSDGRPVSARNATVLPARLTTVQRLERALLAVVTPARDGLRCLSWARARRLRRRRSR
jgi:hypothetical protein